MKKGTGTKRRIDITFDIGLIERAHAANMNVSKFCNDMVIEFLPIFEEFLPR